MQASEKSAKTIPSRETSPSDPLVAEARVSKVLRVRRILAAAILAVCPVIACAFLARNSGRWDLFERSGSITTTIGLILASRPYVKFSALELAVLQANRHVKSNTTEVLEEVSTTKLGLALSAFGTVIWGWGQYLRWWSFGYLAVWALFVIRDVRRDRNMPGFDGPG